MSHVPTTAIAERLYVNGNSASVIQTTRGVSVNAGVFALDFSLGNNFNLVLDTLSVLDSPLNATAGQSGMIFLTQDAIGNRLLSFASVWRFPNGNIPSLSGAAGAVDGLCYMVRVGGATPIITCQIIQGV